MKKQLIKKNKHYCTPFPFPKFYFNKKSLFIEKEVMFDSSCKYELDKGDQADINKLFGFSYGYHHKNSDRIGWRYFNDRIELLYYYYVDGVRHSEYITSVDLNTIVIINMRVVLDNTRKVYITITKDNKELHLDTDVWTKNKPRKYGYTLGLYFGGNRVAPHDMIIYNN